MSSFSDGFMYSLGSVSAWALVALVAFSIVLGIGWHIARRLTAPIRMVGDAASTGVEYLSHWRK